MSTWPTEQPRGQRSVCVRRAALAPRCLNSPAARVVGANLLRDLWQCVFVQVDEPLLLSGEVVDVAGVDVEPQSVNVDLTTGQPALQHAVRADVLQLLKCVHLQIDERGLSTGSYNRHPIRQSH